MLAPLYKARADTLPGQAKQWNIFGTSIVTFEIEGQILKMTLPQKNGHKIKTPEFIKINDLGVILLGKSFHTQICTQLFHSVPSFLEIIDRKCCIAMLYTRWPNKNGTE